jgi:hypothetical protein
VSLWQPAAQKCWFPQCLSAISLLPVFSTIEQKKHLKDRTHSPLCSSEFDSKNLGCLLRNFLEVQNKMNWHRLMLSSLNQYGSLDCHLSLEWTYYVSPFLVLKTQNWQRYFTLCYTNSTLPFIFLWLYRTIAIFVNSFSSSMDLIAQNLNNTKYIYFYSFHTSNLSNNWFG